MKEIRIFEPEVGEVFEWNGVKLKCVTDAGCKDCYFRGSGCDSTIGKNPPCNRRTDKQSVKFVIFEEKEPELKPCPFCGGRAAILSAFTKVACISCGAATVSGSVTAAVQNWNMRTV